MSPRAEIAAGFNPGQERDEHGRFGSGGGGTGEGLPKHDTHAVKEGGGRFQNGTAKEAQITWAHDKAREQGRSTYMTPNPGYDPAKVSTGGPFKLSYKPPKGEHHEVKPDGTMVYHPAPAKPPRAGKSAPKGTVLHAREDDGANADFARALQASRRPSQVSFARAIEAAVEGTAPTGARLWRAGWNKTDKGDLNFTPRSAKLVMEAYEKRGNPLAFYYEHEDRIALESRGGAPMKGVCAAPSSALAVRDSDEGPELWAENIEWTAEAKRQIETGERRQISPIAAFDTDTREIVEILNVSLCAEGATHHGTLLASRTGKGTGTMDELMQKLMEAIEAGDFETAENIVQQMEAADGEGAATATKMAKMAIKCAKDAAAPPPKGDEGGGPDSSRSVAAKKLAASRVQSETFTREIAELRTATANANRAALQSRKATVQTLIAANRPFFDVADEREHMNLADPDATQRHIASMQRKATQGLLVASRGDGAGQKSEAKPPKDAAPAKKPEDELSAADRIAIDQFNRGKKPEHQMTAADFLASKNRLTTSAPTAPGGRA